MANYKLVNDGVQLYFRKVCNSDGKLKKKLFNWYCKIFENTRCEFSKELNYFTVFYRDATAKNLNLLPHLSLGEGFDLTVMTSGSLVGKPEKFVGSEFVCDFNGLTKLVYDDFCESEIKSPLAVAEQSIKIHSITELGKMYDKLPIESILAEYQDPFKRGLA